MTKFFDEKVCKTLFVEADEDKSGTVELKELKRLLPKLNINLSSRDTKLYFKEEASDKKGRHLNFEEFREVIEKIQYRSEIDEVFTKINGGKNVEPERFAQWIRDGQGEHCTTEQAKAMIYELQGDACDGHLSLVGFHWYMNSSKYNSAQRMNGHVYQNMKQPLSDYWLASSHNTYATGHQLRGEASVEMYRQAFERGARCVELDVWDGDDDEPIITHGHTLMSSILFKDVIQCIADHAFVQNPYPVVLSFENHCSPKYQEVMAQHLKTILGDKLGGSLGKVERLPSPDDLKYKVLVKGKMVGDPLDEEDEETEAEEKEMLANVAEENKDKVKKKEFKKAKVVQALSDTTSIRGVKFKKFDADHQAWEMSSFTETKFEKLRSKGSASFVDLHRKKMSKMYPKGSRVFDSSNPDPVWAWCTGLQVAAINYQYVGMPMWLYQAWFHDNGNCGYVLQPPELRYKTELKYDPFDKAAPKVFTLTMRMMSGFRLPPDQDEKVIDPYVSMELRGVPQDDSKCRTKAISNNGFHPIWDETFTFELAQPDLAVLMFSVYDKDLTSDSVVAQCGVRVAAIQQGWRCLELYDKYGKKSEFGGTLLAHFTIQDRRPKERRLIHRSNKTPTKCQECKERKSRARLKRKGKEMWLCKPCIAKIQEHFLQHGTIRGGSAAYDFEEVEAAMKQIDEEGGDADQ